MSWDHLSFSFSRGRRPLPLRLATLWLCLLALPSVGHAQNCIDYQSFTRFLSITEVDRFPVDVEIVGNYAFVLNTGTGMQIIDIRDPNEPEVVGRTNWPLRGTRVVVHGAHAYIPATASFLHVVDVSDVTNPRVIARLDAPSGKYADIAFDDELGYVVSDYFGLQVLDVSRPALPATLATLQLPESPTSIAIDANVAYITTGGGHLQLVDITDRHDPVLLGSVPLSPLRNALNDVVIQGTHAFVAHGHRNSTGVRGIHVVNAEDPKAPSLVASLPLPGAPRKLAWSGSRLITDGSFGAVIDVSSPESPVLLGPFNFITLGVATREDLTALIIDREMVLYDASNPDPVRPGAQLDFENRWTSAIALVNDQAYVAALEKIVQIDVSSPLEPTVVRSIPVEGKADRMVVSGNLVYFTCNVIPTCSNGALQILDLSRGPPAAIGFLALTGVARALALQDNKLYIAGAALEVIDVSQPQQPQRLATMQLPAYAGGIVTHGNVLFALCDRELVVVNIEDVSAPRIVSQMEIGWTQSGIAIDGNLLIVGTHESLLIFDITDPSSPAVIGRAPTPRSVDDLAVLDGVVYTHQYSFGVQLFDIGDPSRPRATGSSALEDHAVDLAVSASGVFLPLWEKGLVVLPTQCMETTVLVSGLRGQMDEHGVTLEWSADHEDFERFEVHRADLVDQEPGPYVFLGYGTRGHEAPSWQYEDRDVRAGNFAYRLIAFMLDGTSLGLGPVFISGPDRVHSISLLPIRPSPVRTRTRFLVDIGSPMPVSLDIYDVRGRRIRSLWAGPMPGGQTAVLWDGRAANGTQVPSGLYFAKLQWSRGVDSARFSYIR